MTKEKALAKAIRLKLNIFFAKIEASHQRIIRNVARHTLSPTNRLKFLGRAAAFMILYNIFASTLLGFNMNHYRNQYHWIEFSKVTVIPLCGSLVFSLVLD